jgi:outer membrane protein assembly factor BamE (lipoprotein component of BamABCDE complex)
MAYGTADDLQKVSLGMTKPEVVAVLGDPSTVAADADKAEEHLYYNRMARVTGWSPTSYRITLRDGKVVKYGEAH